VSQLVHSLVSVYMLVLFYCNALLEVFFPPKSVIALRRLCVNLTYNAQVYSNNDNCLLLKFRSHVAWAIRSKLKRNMSRWCIWIKVTFISCEYLTRPVTSDIPIVVLQNQFWTSMSSGYPKFQRNNLCQL